MTGTDSDLQEWFLLYEWTDINLFIVCSSDKLKVIEYATHLISTACYEISELNAWEDMCKICYVVFTVFLHQAIICGGIASIVYIENLVFGWLVP